jgi:hypothetical protein
MTTSRSSDDNIFEIPLKLSKILEDSEIIHKFVIDTDDKYVKLRLNSKVNPPIALDASTAIIKEKEGWKKFTNGFSNDLKRQKLDSKYHTWIISTINENGDLIRSIVRTTNNYNNTTNSIKQKKYEQTENDVIPIIQLLCN